MNLVLGLVTLGMAIFMSGQSSASEVAKLLGAPAGGERNLVRLSDYMSESEPSNGEVDATGNGLRKDGVMNLVADGAGKGKEVGVTRVYNFVTPSKDYDVVGLSGFGTSGGGISFIPVPESKAIIPLVVVVGLSAGWLWRRVGRVGGGING